VNLDQTSLKIDFWEIFVDVAMNIWVPQNMGNFLNS